MLTPIMASRLMLSLKKTSVEPRGPWSLQSVSSLSATWEDESTRLPSRATDESLQVKVPDILNRSTDERDIELETLP